MENILKEAKEYYLLHKDLDKIECLKKILPRYNLKEVFYKKPENLTFEEWLKELAKKI